MSCLFQRRRYIRLSRLAGDSRAGYAGQMVALKKNSTFEYLSQDHLGSTSITTNTSGAVTSRIRYKPFGEVLQTNGSETDGTLNTEYKFTGQRYDTGTDL